MQFKLDPKSCAVGLAVGVGVMVVAGMPWRTSRAADGPAPAAHVAGAQRYQLRTWANANQTSRDHGAYLLDTYTGDVRIISEGGNVTKVPNKD